MFGAGSSNRPLDPRALWRHPTPCYAEAPPAANRYCDRVPHSLPNFGCLW